MARAVITGFADGLGRAAARTLLDEGHEVVVHARSADRLEGVRDLLDRGAAGVVGDLSGLRQRCRPGLGPDEDGRPRSSRRPPHAASGCG